MRIEQLYLFPVKSLAGIEMTELSLTETGPAFDRAWMVVDENGKFLTQRELPRMALVRPSLEAGTLTLTLQESGESLAVPEAAGEGRPVKVWSDSLPARDCGEPAAAFLTRFLGRACRLVRLTDPRTKDGEHARALSFVDDYPLHIVPLASLEDLNARAQASPPLGVLRFRPNIVVSDTEPWEEDRWKALKLPGTPHELRAGRACTRCAITTVDPASAARGTEPLRTLAGFRRNAQNKLEFGLYLHSAPGAVLRVGQELEIVYKRGQGPE